MINICSHTKSNIKDNIRDEIENYKSFGGKVEPKYNNKDEIEELKTYGRNKIKPLIVTRLINKFSFLESHKSMTKEKFSNVH